jgi:quercetin dioxygenase-like cupin family protein
MEKHILKKNSADLPFHEMLPGAKVRFVHSDKMTLAEWKFESNIFFPKHSHEHEQITKIISGSFELNSDDATYLLEEGDSAIIPSNIVHSGRSITPCHIIDVFYPVREDYK